MTESIGVYPDAVRLVQATADLFTATVGEALLLRESVAVALSGGSTPRPLFHFLAKEYAKKLDWGRVHFFWADERAVPPDHEQSNFRMAHAELLGPLAIPSGNIHRIAGELPAAAAAALYEADLKTFFGSEDVPVFDLILLGAGEDGHTASLFPSSGSLTEHDKLAVSVYHSASETWRITLTLPVLNNASCILFIVSGASKAGIIGQILGRNMRDAYPAGLIRPARGKIFWLLDHEAAADLTMES